MNDMTSIPTGGAVAIWDPNSGAALPAHLADALGDMGSNIPDRQTVPSLSYEGKTWQIKMNGQTTKLQAQNSDGDLVPVPIMRALILNFNSERGRAYYPGTYDPSKSSAPECWSPDGKAPDASVTAPKCATCQGCPMSVKGSKIDMSNGKETVACSSHRMIALVPAFDIGHDPLRLKIAVTSDYDKEVVEHGWFAFRQYVDFLKQRGISHTALVVTKIKFDPNVAYPKLLFALDRPLTAEEVNPMKAAHADPKVAALLAETWTAAGSNGTPVNDSDIKPHGLEGAYADGWIAHPDAAGYSYKGQEVLTNDVLAARYPAPVAAPAPAPEPVAPAAPPIPAPAPAPVVAAVDPLDAARADGWIAHPSAPGYHYKGQDVIADADLAAQYSAPAPAVIPAAEQVVDVVPVVAVAPAAVEPPAGTPLTPLELAQQDGWIAHPDAAGYHYKGQDVKADAEVAALYAGGNGAAAAVAGSTTASPAASPSSATSATTSPSEGGELTGDVAALLSKWA